jgi:transcription initiation factor TFIID subunit 6
MPGNSENVTVKPLVKHLLSKELQLYYERVCSAVTDETNEALRNAALASLRSDPGLHQLLPYFLQFVSEKVTHKLRDMFVLTQMMDITHALLENESLFVEPYVLILSPSQESKKKQI